MSNDQIVPVIGIIGGVGSGKSSVAQSLSANGDFVVIDGDRAGHEVLKSHSAKKQIQQLFGGSVFDEKGEICRAALGRLVFGDGDANRRARSELENIVHPRIRKILQRQIKEATESEFPEAIILDAAVLLEAGWDDLCHSLVFIATDDQQRLERVATSRGWSESQLKARGASQLPLESKRESADYVINNSRTVEEAARELRNIISKVQHKLRQD